MTSSSINGGSDQEWRRWNTNQAIHNSVKHCSPALLSAFLKIVQTQLIKLGNNAA